MKTTIAINIGHKFAAIKAEQISILGIPAGVHRRINKTGWAVTHIGTGLVLAKGVSRLEAIASANVRVAHVGVDNVKDQIAKAEPAPAVDTLEAYVAPAKIENTVDRDAIISAIATRGQIDPAIVARIICSKGKNKGRLIATCPPIFGPKADKEAAAVWLGIQPNPFKVSVGKVLFLSFDLQELTLQLGKIEWPAWLDADKASLVALGVW